MSNRTIIDNSIWVNGIQKDSEGYTVFYPLGTNKVEIPKNSPRWPKGNKLIGQLVYKDDKLVGFCDTKAMTSTNNGEIIVMPYEHIDTKFDSIEKDSIQIHAPKATVKKASWKGSGEKVDIPDVEYKYKGCKTVNAIKTVDENYLENDIKDGKWSELLSDLDNSASMFQENVNITSFTSDLSSLTYAQSMFYKCSNLTSFEGDLSSLTNGRYMFGNCSNLVSFASNLSSLTNGDGMFHNCSNLTTFTADLSSLINGQIMFRDCSSLTSFDFKLSSIIEGVWMFAGCSNLSTFKSDLSSLTNGGLMFVNCKLDAISVKNIIDTINTVESANLTLGVGCDNNNEDKDLFAQEVGYSDMNTLLTALQNKGWTVTAQYTGRPSTNYSLRQPESLPVFVKLVEVSLDEEIPFYEYTSIDGSKFFNLDWFHETTGSTDGYTQFNSFQEAISTLNIKQIEK